MSEIDAIAELITGAQGFSPTVHRGISIRLSGKAYDAIHDPAASPEDIAQKILSQTSRRALGMHWSTDLGQAREFASKSPRTGSSDLPIVLHAEHPAPEDIETRPFMLNRREVHGPEHWEQEVPVRKGRDVQVTGVSWRPHEPHPAADANGWVHYNLNSSMPHTAAKQAAEGYWMSHRPQRGPKITDITSGESALPADTYDHPEYYADTSEPGIGETMQRLRELRGKPSSSMVTVYRSAPAGSTTHFNPGDWVSLSKEYAASAGRHPTDPSQDMPVYSAQVPAEHVEQTGDYLPEQGYWGPKVPVQHAKAAKVAANSGVMEYLDARHPGLEHFVTERPDSLTLNKIVVPKDRRGQGKGSAYMRDLLDYADQHGKRVDLTPSADFGGTKSRLQNFYRGFGFTPNKGRNRVFESSEDMVRPVQSQPEVVATVKDPEFEWPKLWDSAMKFATKAMDTGEPDFLFHVQASWTDVRRKAKDIRKSGGVRILAWRNGELTGQVQGDTNVYETNIVFVPGSRTVGAWNCGCAWAAYSWGRTGRWKKFEGRQCAHSLALQYEAQAQRMFGKDIRLDVDTPHWIDPTIPVRVPNSYDRDKGRHSVKVALSAEPKYEDYGNDIDRFSNDRHQWRNDVRRSLSMGETSPEHAQELGYSGLGHDQSNGALSWKPLPKTLYHVTTNVPAVHQQGLKSRAELAQQFGKGLGGGEDDTISYTDEPQAARNILHSVKEFHNVVTGKTTPQNLWDSAARGEGTSRPFHTDIANYYDSAWKPGDPIPRELDATLHGMKIKQGLASQDEMDAKEPGWLPHPDSDALGANGKLHTLWQRDASPEERREDAANLYKRFSAFREGAGGHPDPLFFSTDLAGFAATNPAEHGIVKAHPKPGAQGYQLGSLGEWRTTTGQNVDVDRSHDPKTAAATIHYMRNNSGMRNVPGFSQDVEPWGKYLTEQDPHVPPPEGWEHGDVTFANPLHIEHDGGAWKQRLSQQHGGLTGQALSNALMDKGHDGVITHDKYGIGEIVDLRPPEGDRYVTASASLLHRGVMVETDPYELRDIHAQGGMPAVHEHLRNLALRQEGIGTHWTTRPEIAQGFGAGPMHGDKNNAEQGQRTYLPYYNTMTVPVMLHGQIDPQHVETDPEKLRDAMVEGHGWNSLNFKNESEKLIKPGAPVHVTSMEAALPSDPQWMDKLGHEIDYADDLTQSDLGAHTWQPISGDVGIRHTAALSADESTEVGIVPSKYEGHPGHPLHELDTPKGNSDLRWHLINEHGYERGDIGRSPKQVHDELHATEDGVFHPQFNASYDTIVHHRHKTAAQDPDLSVSDHLQQAGIPLTPEVTGMPTAVAYAGQVVDVLDAIADRLEQHAAATAEAQVALPSIGFAQTRECVVAARAEAAAVQEALSERWAVRDTLGAVDGPAGTESFLLDHVIVGQTSSETVDDQAHAKGAGAEWRAQLSPENEDLVRRWEKMRNGELLSGDERKSMRNLVKGAPEVPDTVYRGALSAGRSGWKPLLQKHQPGAMINFARNSSVTTRPEVAAGFGHVVYEIQGQHHSRGIGNTLHEAIMPPGKYVVQSANMRDDFPFRAAIDGKTLAKTTRLHVVLHPAESEKTADHTDMWPPYLTERPDEYGDLVPVNESRHNARGPIMSEDDAKASGLVGPYWHGTSKRRAADIRSGGFRQPRLPNWEMGGQGTIEEIDKGNTHRTYFADNPQGAWDHAVANHGKDNAALLKVYLHPDHIETDSGGGWYPSTQVRDVTHAAVVPEHITPPAMTSEEKLLAEEQH